MISFLNYKAKARHVAGLSYLTIAVLLLTGSSAFAQSDSARLNRLENDIQTLNRAVYKGEMPPPSAYSGASGSSNAAASEVRIQQLESELQKLTGQIEEQNFKIKQMEQQLQRFTEDMNMRMSDIEGNGGANVNGSATGVNRASQYIARSPSTGAMEPPMPDASITNTASTTSTTTTTGGTGYQWSSGPPGVEVNSAVAGSNPASIYENAYTLMKNNDYDGAEKGFQTFLDANPDHPLAGNAKYWLGETYYVRNDYKNAARVFAEAYQQYPKNSKAADNLLKLGMALAGMGKKDDACVAFGQVKKEYTGKADAVVKRSEQEMSNLGCK